MKTMRMFTQSMLIKAILILASITILCFIVVQLIVAAGNNYEFNQSRMQMDKFQDIASRLEFNELNDATKRSIADDAPFLGDHANVIITDDAGKVVYSLNANFMPDKDTFTVISNTDNGMPGGLYITDNQNRIRYQANLFKQGPGFMQKLPLEKGFLIKGVDRVRMGVDNDYPSIYLNKSFIGSKGWNLYTVSNSSRQISFSPPYPLANDLAEYILRPICLVSFFIYWLLIPIWVFRDASKRNFKAPFWGLLALAANFIGLVIYLALRPEFSLCESCNERLDGNFLACPHCGRPCKKTCLSCKHAIEEHWQFCPYCNHPIEEHLSGA